MLAVVWLAISGCGRPAPAPLRVAAASDLNLALPELARRFRDKTGIVVSITFGSSGQLAEQIKQGAPFDIFLSANEAFVRDLAVGGFVAADSVAPYAQGSLVLAVFGELPDNVRSLDDLTRTEVKKIAIGNPATAPYGKAAKRALERAGLWEKLEPKIVIAESVRQALLYVQQGNAEAALVGRAIAGVPEVRSFDVAPRLYDPIIQALGVVSSSTHGADAGQFTRFVLDDEGQRLLKKFGFTTPSSAPQPDSDDKSQTPGQPARPGPDGS